ncbi:MAG: hypothetical protein EDX89_16250 [Acidobacteria bacterium]|nr:MAG: hypothetical protein EDX89_16250 [Acidobacteriota bacterium]MCE7956844.1 hypothetical protein [Acidobacteria bacterium ACB2]
MDARTSFGKSLSGWAGERGFRVGWGPLEVVDAALDDVRGRGLSRALAAYASESLATDAANVLAARGLRSVFVVVVPRPAHTVLFDREEGTVEALFPPTYVRYRDLFEELRTAISEGPLAGARVETLNAPLKQVASRLGLVSYGRNNVTYAEGAGSWLQLAGYATDARLPHPAAWRLSEPALLERCRTCRACLKSCPTDAISADRVLIHADRCLTFANEVAGEWPAWVEPKAHHALVGCLLCQTRCPENPKLSVEASGVVFTREETASLLSGREDRDDPSWPGIRAKLGRLGQPQMEDVLGRNLRALVAARGAASR